ASWARSSTTSRPPTRRPTSPSPRSSSWSRPSPRSRPRAAPPASIRWSRSARDTPEGMRTLEALAAALRARAVTSVDATRACLEPIARPAPALTAFITVPAEPALAQARIADDERAAGRDRGPLHGVPIALKDLVDTAGVATTAASGVHEG